MLAKSVLVGLLSLTLAVEASVINGPFENVLTQRASRTLQARQNKGGNKNGGNQNTGNQNTGNQNQNNQNNNNNNGGSATCLSANALQTGSAADGSSGASAGQANSATFVWPLFIPPTTILLTKSSVTMPTSSTSVPARL